jgi:threonine synthase
MPVKYRSTRGGHRDMSFEDVVIGGLATDKGLYVPESVPVIAAETIQSVSWREHVLIHLCHT